MHLIARLSAKPIDDVPDISLRYLIFIFSECDEGRRTFTELLAKLHYDGFIAKEDFNESTLIPKTDARRYYIHWCEGMERSAYRGRLGEFDAKLKHSILFYGGVLADIKITTRFDHDGLRTAGSGGQNVPVNVKMGDNRTIKRNLGHAVFIVNWKVVRGKVRFIYLNCYGQHWGIPPHDGAEKRGFGVARSSAIHHVYVPQVLKWFS